MNYKQALVIFYIFLLGIVITGVESFAPVGRIGHSSILVGTKLYFFGGSIGEGPTLSNEVFYLDVSQTFNIASPPWTELKRIPVGIAFAGMSLIDINNNPTVYLFGGLQQDSASGNITFISIIHSFNVKTLEWKIPNINGEIPARRKEIRAVSDNKGKLYVFGGDADNLIGSPTIQFFNDMVILDTTSLIWSYGSTLNVPTKRNCYSATLLTNGVIVYIGGEDENHKMLDINQINLYDTNLDSWSVMIAKNTSVIESRRFHSAVLVPDGNVVIYGGEKSTPVANTFASVEPDIAILNTQNTPFEWIVPTISPYVNNKPPSLTGHTANLVGNYMIVAFGFILSYDGKGINPNLKIYTMDIRNYTWIDTFVGEQPEKRVLLLDYKMKIVVGVLSGVVGIVFLSATGFLGYKLYKKYKKEGNIPQKFSL